LINKQHNKTNLIQKTIRWLLLAAVILFVVTGFGISEFRTMETLTFGLLTKTVSFRIHEVLWIPLTVLLGAHILYPLCARLWKRYRS